MEHRKPPRNDSGPRAIETGRIPQPPVGRARSCLSSTLVVAALLSIPAGAATKVACVGNSITYGMGIPDQPRQSYPARLQDSLGSTYQTSNFGVSARTLLKNGDLPYWKEAAYTNSQTFAPNIVVVELGTNDSKLGLNWRPHGKEFVADYKAFVDSYAKLPSKPKIWLCLCPPANNPSWDMYDTTLVRQVNPKILEVALAKGVGVIDLHTGMSGGGLFQSDNVHPNAAGARKMASIVKSLIAAPLLTLAPTAALTNNNLHAPAAAGYQWYRNDTLLAGQTGNYIPLRISGVYKASLKLDAKSESRVITQTFVYNASGVLDRAAGPVLRLGARGGMLRIESDGALPARLSVEVRDVAGRSLLRRDVRTAGASMEIGGIPATLRGIYLVRLKGAGLDVTGSVILGS
jgi:lysophospholipase L1-like esterase